MVREIELSSKNNWIIFLSSTLIISEEQTLLENSAGDEHPVVVHCSDGSLRTGLYIGVDQLIYSLDKESYFDILGLAHKMKSSRNFCLQHEVSLIYYYNLTLARSTAF